jgi:hypothetical protein
MAPITEKTILDQETGYSSLSEATPLKIAEPKKSWRRVGVAAAVLSALILGAVAALKTTSPKRASKKTNLAYPLVSVSNSVPYVVSGTVVYASAFCSNDDFDITPNTVWTATSRGVCLVTKIKAYVKTPNGNVDATPYESSGTSYSQFAVINYGDGNNFQVTRRVS